MCELTHLVYDEQAQPLLNGAVLKNTSPRYATFSGRTDGAVLPCGLGGELGEAVSAGTGIDGLAAAAVSLGAGGGLLLAPVSAGVAGEGGAA